MTEYPKEFVTDAAARGILGSDYDAVLVGNARAAYAESKRAAFYLLEDAGIRRPKIAMLCGVRPQHVHNELNARSRTGRAPRTTSAPKASSDTAPPRHLAHSGAKSTPLPTSVDVPPLTPLKRLKDAADRIHDTWPEAGTPVKQDDEAIVEEMMRRVREDNWAGATVAASIRAARVVFSAAFRSGFRHGRLKEFYVDEVRASRNSAFLGGMMSVYLGTFEPGANHTRGLASALSEARPNLGQRWSDLLEKYPDLLDPGRAHEHIARGMASMHDPWRELKDRGIRSPHGQGLMSHVHFAYLKEIQDRLGTREGIDTLARWLKPNGADAKLVGAEQAIEALLRPWLRRTPQEELREHLADQLLRLYRDPRIASGAPWALVGDRYTALLRRWLTGHDIVFFLDVVSEVNRSHMWPERREFWLGLYEQGRIADAWVAFSSVAERHAERICTDDDGRDLVYGRQTGPRPDTSLLILRIGNCVVVEGSHNYKVQFFKSSNARIPRLFGTAYDCDLIRLQSDEDQVHLGDWRSRVREKLAYLS